MTSSLVPLYFSVILLIIVLFLASPTQAFHIKISNAYRHNSMKMLFGGGAKKASGKVVIKVDGKTIEAEGSVNLRKELQKNNVDVYPLRAKITGNCGGAGICGTCTVKVLEGAQNINPPSKNEQNTLRGKPADFRLSCCAKVSGPISIKTKVN